jgi:hypothetical protein
LRNVEILFERRRDIPRHQRVLEVHPPGTKVGRACALSIRDARFAHKVRSERNVGLTIVGADRAAREQADAQEKGDESKTGKHGGFPEVDDQE